MTTNQIRLPLFALIFTLFLCIPKSWFSSCKQTDTHIRAKSDTYGRVRIFTGTKAIVFLDCKSCDTIFYLREISIGNRTEYYNNSNQYFMTTSYDINDGPNFWNKVTYLSLP